MMRKVLYIVWMGVNLLACGRSSSFTRVEQERVGVSADAGIMPLYTIEHREDSLFLRQRAKELLAEDVTTETYRVLRSRMLATVNDTSNQGVGIAAPQVGVSKQMIAVQRLDKPGEPFEIYVNPNIIYYSKDSVWGREGCLSIPDRVDSLFRSRKIVLRFRDEHTFAWKQDTVNEFTARIFQHEIDHLNGVLYIDYTR